MSITQPVSAAKKALRVDADAPIHVDYSADTRVVHATVSEWSDRRHSPRFLEAADGPLYPHINPLWALSKRTLDIVGSLLLLALLAPVLLVIGIQVARSGSDVLFGHRRIGRHGKWFTCYKFTTMVPNAEAKLARMLLENPEMKAEWDSSEKLRNDPRVTSIGRFLRRTSLDELPQLLNVLKGDMSLVGPRPATEIGRAQYGRAWRCYLAVRPGMTGLWQVSGRNEVGFRRRVALDVYYVRNQSLLLDAEILLRTIRVVAYGTGC